MQNCYSRTAVLFVLILAFAQLSSSQVLYTDVIPDTTFEAPDTDWHQYYSVDMNNDGSFDIRFCHLRIPGSMTIAEVASYPTAEAAVLVNGENSPLALQSGAIIDANGIWIDTNHFSSGNVLKMNEAGVSDEPWDGVTDLYLGVRIKVAGEWRYGWIRLDVPADASKMTVKDYALNLTAAQGISAGDKGATNVDRVGSHAIDAEVYTTGKTIYIIRKGTAACEQEVRIFSLQGSLVSSCIIQGREGKLRIPFAVSGVYLVLLSEPSRHAWHKVVIL